MLLLPHLPPQGILPLTLKPLVLKIFGTKKVKVLGNVPDELDPRSWLWHWLRKICLSALQMRIPHQIIIWLMWLMQNKKVSASVECWVKYVTLTFDHTHDLDLEVSRSKFWKSLISGMGVLNDMVWKGCELSIHYHDIDLFVTMVGCVDVPDSDRGDFRCPIAIDITSWNHKEHKKSCLNLYSALHQVHIP